MRLTSQQYFKLEGKEDSHLRSIMRYGFDKKKLLGYYIGLRYQQQPLWPPPRDDLPYIHPASALGGLLQSGWHWHHLTMLALWGASAEMLGKELLNHAASGSVSLRLSRIPWPSPDLLLKSPWNISMKVISSSLTAGSSTGPRGFRFLFFYRTIFRWSLIFWGENKRRNVWRYKIYKWLSCGNCDRQGFLQIF